MIFSLRLFYLFQSQYFRPGSKKKRKKDVHHSQQESRVQQDARVQQETRVQNVHLEKRVHKSDLSYSRRKAKEPVPCR